MGVKRVINFRRSPHWFAHFQFDTPLPEQGTKVRVTSNNPSRQESLVGTYHRLTSNRYFLIIRVPDKMTEVCFDPAADPQVTMEVLT